MLGKAMRLFMLVLGVVPAISFAQTPEQQSLINMTRGVTEVSHEVYELHMFMFWVCVVIGVIVFGYLLWALIFHRKSAGHKPAQFHEHLGAEIAWTVIPFIILGFMAWPATYTLIKVYDTSEAELDIKVTGYQWKWQYEYLGEGFNYMSELATPPDQIYNLDDKGEFYLQEVTEPLVIPVDTKVRFLVTSKDVIHAWWVPAFAVKRDAIPGYTVETWTKVDVPGTYRGECAELCGQDHAFMPIVVEVLPKDEYNIWLEEKKEEAAAIAALVEKTFTMEESMEMGQEVYERSCAVCHGANGEGLGSAFPAIAGSPIATGDLNAHLDTIVNGVAGTAMQSFITQLSEADIAAAMTYQRNAFGNNTGDLVQPVDVYNFANGQ